MENLKFVIDNDLLKYSAVLTSITSPINENIALLVMGENVKPLSKENIIRIYLTQRNSRNQFHITAELEVFQFASYQSAKAFVKRLPEMTALEMLLLINRIPLQETSRIQ